MAKLSRAIAPACVLLAWLSCSRDSSLEPGPPGPPLPSQAVKLVFASQPDSTLPDGRVSPTVEVAVVDAAGGLVNWATHVITIDLGLNPAGATLSGTRSVAAIDGIARFSDLRLDRIGAGYTLVASATNLTGATSRAFAVGPPGSTLVFRRQPTAGTAGVLISPPIEVAVADAAGHEITTLTALVTLTIDQARDGLVGTTTVVTAGGIARFGDLNIARPGEGMQLIASAPGLPSTTSAPFAISAPVPFQGSSVAPAGYSTCALDAGGAAWCWGDNTWGQLGSGRILSATAPLRVAGGLRFRSISLAKATGTNDEGRHRGDYHGTGLITCGLTDLGKAYCWGGGPEPVNGVESAVPGPVAGALTFTALRTARGRACGVTPEGTMWCWNSPEVTTALRAVPFRVGDTLRFGAFDISAYRACGLSLGRAAYCWGETYLGDGTRHGSNEPVAVSSAGAGAFTAITVGQGHSCALSSSGEAWCWGGNYYGELGTGMATEGLEPARVSGDVRFSAISAGSFHTCALTAEGEAWCWGGNWKGQLGDGSNTTRTTPVPVSGGLRFVSISAGWAHTCGVTSSGEAWCWGWSNDGQLGDGHWSSTKIPVRVETSLRFREIAAGGDATCGITTDGNGWCWGGNFAGELGDGNPLYSAVPLRVTGGFIFKNLSAGHNSVCGVTTSGETRCWGFISDGLGKRGVPVKLNSDPGFTTISVGGGNGCGIVESAEGWCWGGTTSPSPVRVFGGPSFTDVFADSHACALTTAGDTYCSGSPGSAAETTPTLLGGGLKFVTISGGGEHDCGLTGSGEAYCWGANHAGQLGDGSRTPSTTPVPVRGGLRFSMISAGHGQTCGVTLQQQGYCWTMDGNNRGYSTPTLVPGGLSFATIKVSHGYGGHACGITTSGALYCWGNVEGAYNNHRGQLGSGSASRNTSRTAPTLVVGGLNLSPRAAPVAQARGLR